MICKHCGKEIAEELTFCLYCGAPQTEDAKRPVPEQKKKSSVLGPLLLVLAFAAAVAAGVWLLFFRGAEAPARDAAPVQTEAPALPAEETIPRVIVDEAAYRSLAEEFSRAILLGDLDAIGADVHPGMREPLVEMFGKAEFVFESCTVESSGLRKIRRSEERAYESGLYEDFGMSARIDDAYEITVDFEAVYHGKPYAGEMTVLVADMDGGRYVVQSVLSDMDVSFYEDNYDRGDYYFDTHSEE